MANAWYDYPTTQPFKWGWTHPKAHSGIDLGAPYGTPYTAPASGTIISQGMEPWGGQINELVQTSAGPEVISALHLSRLNPGGPGPVKAGQVIGATGAPPAGGEYGSGAHLHWEETAGNLPPYMSSYNPWYPTQAHHPLDPTLDIAALRVGNKSGGGSLGSDSLLGGQLQGGTQNCDPVAVSKAIGECANQCAQAHPGDQAAGQQCYFNCIAPYSQCQSPVGNPLDAAGQAVQALGNAITGIESGAATFGKRAAVFVLALTMIAAGWWVLMRQTDFGADVTTQIQGALGGMPLQAKATTVYHRQQSAVSGMGIGAGVGAGAGAGTGTPASAGAGATRPAAPHPAPLRFPFPARRGGKAPGGQPAVHHAAQAAAFRGIPINAGRFAGKGAPAPAPSAAGNAATGGATRRAVP